MNMLENDGKLILSAPDAEEAEYVPADGGMPRDITIVGIDRHPPSVIPESGGGEVMNAKMTFAVSQSLENGICASELKVRKDGIKIPLHFGGDPERLTIVGVIYEDARMLQLAAR